MGSSVSTEEQIKESVDPICLEETEIASLEELEQLSRSKGFDQLLEAIWSITDEDEKSAKIERLKRWEKEQKEKFHPEHSHSELKQLKAKAVAALEDSSNDKETCEKHRQLVLKIAEKRVELAQEFAVYERILNYLQKKVAVVANNGTGRSNRAKRAGLLSKHAGKTRIEGAKTDKHGNALGTEYDLGVDGAFDGMKIVVVQLYNFTSAHTTSAFEKKGFKFEWVTSLPTASALEKMLQPDEVCQLWIIGSSGSSIREQHVKVIREFHERGKSLYVWGDNDPFISDANDTLEPLFGIKMYGNVPGGKVVNVCQNEEHRGFVEHLITTGLEHLFEGITVASFDEQKIAAKGFYPLMWGSDANLITIYRPADKLGGAIMADGAFTRLYCNVDDAGTIRYIINCACWLAAESLENQAVFELPEEEEDNVLPSYNADGAYSAKCSILWEPVPISFVSVMELADPERNTGDLVLNDPLGFGESNYKIMGRHLYGEATGQTVMDMGSDPFLRTSVVGLLPVVSLSDNTNRTLFTTELCRVFMGHRKLFSAAQLVFIGVLDSLLDPSRVDNYEPEVRGAFEYLKEQSLQHFLSTPDFTDVGDKVPVVKAMQHYFTVSPPMTQISKSFSTVCLIARVLAEKQLVPVKHLTIIVRRSLLKYIASAAMRFVKGDNESNKMPDLVQAITDKTYNCWKHIPLKDSGHIMTELPSFIPDFFKDPMERYANQTGEKVYDEASITYLFLLLCKKDLRMYKIEGLLEILMKTPRFASLWIGTLLEEEFVVGELNKIFKPFSGADHNSDCIVPFATTYGPTIFRCCECDAEFGDPAVSPSEEYAEQVKKNRNAHFVEHYNSDANGYPTTNSQHYSLHRTVQNVLREKYPNEMELQTSMLDDIAEKLRTLKGNIHRLAIDKIVFEVTESYLACRKKGQEHPPEYINFYDKYTYERDVILANK